MNDVLLRLGRSQPTRRLLKRLGLPLSLPVPLRRSHGPWPAAPLDGHVLWVAARAHAPLAGLREALTEAGARLADPAAPRIDGIVLDATELVRVAELDWLYTELSPRLSKLQRSGRVVLLARPRAEAVDAEAAAAQTALDGFMRSLAKEVGKEGITAQLIRVATGAEPELGPLLRFLLSPRSAFITGQTLELARRTRPGVDRRTQALHGKVALVTGAARGIGRATALALGAEGAHVVCLDRPGDAPELEAVATQVAGTPLLLDLQDRTAPARAAELLRVRHGGLDVIVHNAGVTRDKTLRRMSRAHWDEVIDVNLAAVMRLDEALTGLLRDDGREICLASIAGLAGTVGQTNYAAAKAGLIGYVSHRARALASRGITVNAVAPGLIETRLTAAMPLVVREAGRRLSALGQGGQPSDVAEAVTFLASPGAAGLNGAVLRVCGGGFLGQ